MERVTEFSQVLLGYHSAEYKKHSYHVMEYVKLICMKYNDLFGEVFTDEDIEFVALGAKIHDIGQIFVPDGVAFKEGRYTEAEHEAMKRHTVYGAAVADDMAEIYQLDERSRKLMHNICLYHHERFDGKGYPEGLAGDAIPLEAQIVGLAEVYDALTSEGYSRARRHSEACEMIARGECGAFNPDVVTCFQCLETDISVMAETGTESDFELLSKVYGSNHKRYWVIKRLCDIVLSAGALAVLSVPMLVVALIIFIDDPHGSPIFAQTRVGRHKKPFKFYKFRSMVVNAEELKDQLMALNEKDGPVFKIKDDPRITRIGKFIRKTSIDELPQLWNVLKGDMSIVGPRPPLPKEVEEYSRYQEVKLSVTPGLTCIWQATPHRDEISFDRWIEMDIGYVGARCLSLDAKLILKTILVMLGRQGS